MQTVNAHPTKDFFISMLTRDVPLDRAVLDLVDNSVDAAYQHGGVADKEIKIELSTSKFSIKDNCGGIDRNTAISYAFRFGRSEKDKRETPHSVGQFGVGMKRTLFKIGRKFTINSNTKNQAFKIAVDVNQWLQSDNWDFQLEDIKKEDNEGTNIIVEDLLENAKQQFGIDLFIDNIIKDIEKAHFKAISKGLKIFVNNRRASTYEIKIKSSDLLKPIHYSKEQNGVKYTITAGIDEREYAKGGWYIVCNGRLIEDANTDKSTGWGINDIRKYHPDFAFFRGLVEFESEDSSKLPWTTTKTGVDIDNDLYRSVRKEMTDAMAEITTFLKSRAKEDENFDKGLIENKVLNNSIEQAESVSIFSVQKNNMFISPEPAQKIKNPNPMVSVQYKVSSEKMEKMKKTLEKYTNTEVGSYTFNYVYDYEVGDE
ncbi:ATP-binding protein [Saccharospirillum mangrovi]|uniref:ATP-binding protein n=1 Tax=Saccharospirillum mangrovi TaxID=2161747 RepID=UPI0013005E1E|nr:ATP-binding protein [Saccharospirillum mangrovi]